MAFVLHFVEILVLLWLVWEAVLYTGARLAANYMEYHGRGEAAARVRQWVVAAPSVVGRWLKPDWRYRLARDYLESGNYLQALAQCRAVLAGRCRPAVESRFALLKADCLEGLGEVDAAADERKDALEMLAQAPQDADVRLARAELLDHQSRYTEAYQETVAAINDLKSVKETVRDAALTRAATIAYHAGQQDQAIRWAESALQERPSAMLAMQAHYYGGLACMRQRDLENAERRLRRALDVATKAENKGLTALYRVALADVELRRGRLEFALDECERATASSPVASPAAHLVQGECFELQGNRDACLSALTLFREEQMQKLPSQRSHAEAVADLALARAEAGFGQIGPAAEHLRLAHAGITGDAQLSLVYAATEAWIIAQQGNVNESRTRIHEIAEKLPAAASDHETVQTCRILLGRACLAANAPEQGHVVMLRSLVRKFDPVYRPLGYCLLADCEALLGNELLEHELLEAAVHEKLDTYHSHLARQRLETATPVLAMA